MPFRSEAARIVIDRKHSFAVLAMARMTVCILLSACASGPFENDHSLGVPVETGRLQNAAIGEASGLAVSHRQPERLWTMNDGGSPPVLYAMAYDGTEHGSVQLSNASNVDWEDLASFELDGTPWLLIADVGDNLAKREQVTLYIVEEPDLSTQRATPSRQITFRYPDGPRDVEAVAVDANDQLVYVLSKRTLPAQLYSVPLVAGRSAAHSVITARYLGTVASIPQPTQDDLDRAIAEQNWHWQPTAMSFSADGKTAMVLTYRAVYLYQRHAGEPWLDALQRRPVAVDLGNLRKAEAAALGAGSVFVTAESIHAPIYRIQYRK